MSLVVIIITMLLVVITAYASWDSRDNHGYVRMVDEAGPRDNYGYIRVVNDSPPSSTRATLDTAGSDAPKVPRKRKPSVKTVKPPTKKAAK